MGSWAGTCGITQLPINAGDKCRVFIIVKQDYDYENNGGGHSYANDLWYPRGLPLLGSYDDYGGIEDIVEDLNSKILLDGLKNDWVFYKAENEWENSCGPNDLTVCRLIEETERDRAKVYDGNSPARSKQLSDYVEKMRSGIREPLDKTNLPKDRSKRPLGLFFVHEEVYQNILAYDPLDAHHTDKGFLYRKRSEILNDDMKEWYTNGLEVAKTLKDTDCKLEYLLCGAVSHWNMFSDQRHDPPFCKGMSYYYDFLKNKMVEGVPYEDPDVQIVARGLIDYTKFIWAMTEARRAWMPQSGKGSQDNETQIHKIIAGASLSICAKEDAERAAEDAEWDDGKDWKAEHNKKDLAKRAKIAKQTKTKRTNNGTAKNKKVSTKKAR